MEKLKNSQIINICIILCGTLLIPVYSNSPYPLDPLSPEEIEDTVLIVRGTKNPTSQPEGIWVFNWITLKEPEKSLLLPYFLNGKNPDPDVIPRKSFVLLVEKQRNIVNELVVNLSTRKVESWIALPSGTQTPYSFEEGEDCETIAKEDLGVQQRCHEMGWYNMSLVTGICWGVGYGKDRPQLANLIRPVQIYFYGKMFELDNLYAHPFDFVATVDLAKRKVVLIDNLPTHSDYDADNRVGNVCPRKTWNYDPQLLPPNSLREDIHPIQFSQPAGAGYQIQGNEVTWQKFKFRVGFNAKEGLIIHHVSYQDEDERRPLFYRMAVSELFVPYGDARPPFHQKFPFDLGEWNLGMWGADLDEAGICRGGVVAYLSYQMNNENGESVPLPNVICIYEEDTGLLWAHQTPEGPVVHTRSQRLTVTIFVNEDNYDYKFSWRFYQDASIEFNTELHGVISSQLLAVNATSAGGFGAVVSPQINGQFHQHHITLRLNPAIDGSSNTVSTVDVVPLPDPSGSLKNPYGNGFTTVETVLKTAAEARTNISPMTGRSWLMKNTKNVHPYTRKPVSWKLIPFSGPPVFVRKDSPMHHRCAYTDYNMWVTRYQDGDLYPYGLYENGTGIVEWVNKNPNADITDTDVVLWYTYGFTHIPRTEDWPLMPVESTGFWLRPNNFFRENPGLDVPPPSK